MHSSLQSCTPIPHHTTVHFVNEAAEVAFGLPWKPFTVAEVHNKNDKYLTKWKVWLYLLFSYFLLLLFQLSKTTAQHTLCSLHLTMSLDSYT